MLRIFCLVYLMSIASAVAQDMSGEYAVQHFTDENGLPQNSVKGIAEDHAGFIWLCTEAGLVRFDGRKFYTYDKSNSELKSVRFFGIQPDIEKKSGKMFATADTWQNMQIREGGAQPDSAYFNNSLRKVPYSMAGLSISHISSGAPNSILAQNDSITKYYIILNATEVGSFYIIKHKQIQYFRNWKLAWAQSFDRESLQSFFTLNGRLYYLDSGGRILQFKVGGFDIIKLSGDINQDPLYSGKNGEYRLYWNNISDQAFVWFHDKLYLLDPNARGEMNTELILKGFDFINSNIEKIHYNKRFRRLFLGSTTSGFFTVRPKEFQALRFSEKDGENVFYSQALYSGNSVLTANGIVLGMDSTNGEKSVHAGFIQYMHDRQGHDRRGMFIDREGGIWTKAARTLLRYAPDGSKLIRSWSFQEEIQSMYQGLNGRIWLGMKRGGLYYLSSSGLESPQKLPVKPVKFISRPLQSDYLTIN
jgi:hypothetical protein